MLSFEFSPEQDIFRASLRKFSLEELLPHYTEGDAGIYPRERIIRVIDLIGEVDDESASFVTAGIVAEEVEHQEDFDWLREVGVDFVQGYFVEAPVALGSASTGTYRILNP